MLRRDLVLSIAVFLIAVTNYFNTLFYIILGLLILCGTAFGPGALYYSYVQLSPTYPNGCKYALLGAIIFLISVLYYFDLLVFILYGLLTACGLLLGPFIVMHMNDDLSAKKPMVKKKTENTVNMMNSFQTLMLRQPYFNNEENTDPGRYPLVFSRLVDGALLNLLDIVFRDFVYSWLNDLAVGSDELISIIKQDLWEAISEIYKKMKPIDHTNLVACSMVSTVTVHFERIRIAQEEAINGVEPKYLLSPHLASESEELEYLRKVSEVVIIFFMPRGYQFSPTKNFLREIFTCTILKPLVDTITDPDYINQKILSYVEQQKLVEALHKKTCEYANSFEDFISLIKDTHDLEVLKRMRYYIVSEIMQATTAQNIQRAQGLDPESTSLGKSDASQGKKLKRYISQMTYAKNTCEAHMQALGWDDYPMEDDDVIDAVTVSESRVTPLRVILDSVVGRKYLGQFLEQVSSQGLVGYWTAVQELRAADKSNWHQLGAEIFYTYIAIPTAEIKVDKEARKRMESFLLGDKGPDVFYEVQDTVVQIMEDKYYPSFIVSKQYKNLQETLTADETLNASMNDERVLNGTILDNSTALVGEHSNYSRNKLDQLQEKLSNKTQALKALQSSLKPESKVLSILAREVDRLQGEKRQLEAHLSYTEMWAEHLGRWRAEVQSAETPDNGDSPHFVLVVDMIADEADEKGISSGWVVLRKLSEFQELHRKLRQLSPCVKNLELPSQPLKFFGKTDRNAMERAKSQIQKYLNFVLEDDRLNQSEALYVFLSPSSERLKQSNTPSPKKSRFSLTTFFKSSGSSGDSRDKDEEDDTSLFDDNEGSRTVTDTFFGPGKDSIAEPLYALLEEIFDLRGVFRWLRRSLITFVQLTYGRTINRQVRDTVAWIFSEPMLHYYIQLLTKSWWPNGQLVKETPVRTGDDKLKTRVEARQQFLNNVPDFLTNLVGNESAQRGSAKIFDALQNVTLNKQLFYDVFEVVMYEMFPELKKEKY
ncbi:sorting nexin-25 [Copidosoma floridanum]|uniref:sorting nexin-25 n=1 Tax=Copidosoma floridanum TaxID=29053 RepID=UPI000C6F6E27|nr:sorting nexin-25 [Copidosoma floridanum]